MLIVLIIIGSNTYNIESLYKVREVTCNTKTNMQQLFMPATSDVHVHMQRCITCCDSFYCFSGFLTKVHVHQPLQLQALLSSTHQVQ